MSRPLRPIALAALALASVGAPAVPTSEALGEAGGATRGETAGEAPASPILAAYDFERPVSSGPDTFWVAQREGGAIDLTTVFRVSGERSLRLREVPGNGDFVEFLAYFPERTTGAVAVQFYVLFADRGERFNFGLAGQGWFRSRGRDGHAVWLQSQEEQLAHHPAAGWKPLTPLRTFTWYFVDLVYDVDRGTYDLALWEEGDVEPLVDLHGVRAFHDHDRSSVRFASFIGDLEDQGRFDVFVDDLLIASDPAARLAAFVAPGRRRLFVDLLPGQRPPSEQERDDLLEAGWRWLREHPEGGIPHDLAPAAEQAADEALRRERLDLAQALYERLLQGEDGEVAVRAMLKLADVHHLLGHVDEERQLREAIYGRVEQEEERSAPP